MHKCKLKPLTYIIHTWIGSIDIQFITHRDRNSLKHWEIYTFTHDNDLKDIHAVILRAYMNTFIFVNFFKVKYKSIIELPSLDWYCCLYIFTMSALVVCF